MKIPANITIKTNKTLDDPFFGENKNEVSEATINGFIHTTRQGIKIEYMENDPEGSIKTMINLVEDGMVILSRSNEMGMVFERGKTHNYIIFQNSNPLELRIRTTELTNTISREGGQLDVDYTVDVIGNRAEKSHITLSVKPSVPDYVS